MASNPTQDINNPFCQLITREPTTGGVATVTGAFTNIGKIETSGVDFNIDWKADLADMGHREPAGCAERGSRHDVPRQLQDPGSAERRRSSTTPDRWVRVRVSATSTSNSGQYRYKTFTTLGYSVSGVAVNLRWRHLPSADAATKPANPRSSNVGPDSYDIFDLTGNWEISQTYIVRFGIENLLDTDPEIISSQPEPGPGHGPHHRCRVRPTRVTTTCWVAGTSWASRPVSNGFLELSRTGFSGLSRKTVERRVETPAVFALGPLQSPVRFPGLR